MKRDDINQVISSINWAGISRSEQEEIGATLAMLIRSQLAAGGIEDAESTEIIRDENEGLPITVIRDMDGRLEWIIENDANGPHLYSDPQCWAELRDRYASDNGWDAEEEPHVATAAERAGVHQPTGIQYDPSFQQRLAADAELAEMRLWREVCGYPIAE